LVVVGLRTSVAIDPSPNARNKKKKKLASCYYREPNITGKLGRKKVGNVKKKKRTGLRRSGRKERNKDKKRFLLLFGTISFGGDLLA
jgi:hypothetical protein